MSMRIDETGQDDSAGRIENFRRIGNCFSISVMRRGDIFPSRSAWRRHDDESSLSSAPNVQFRPASVTSCDAEEQLAFQFCELLKPGNSPYCIRQNRQRHGDMKSARCQTIVLFLISALSPVVVNRVNVVPRQICPE